MITMTWGDLIARYVDILVCVVRSHAVPNERHANRCSSRGAGTGMKFRRGQVESRAGGDDDTPVMLVVCDSFRGPFTNMSVVPCRSVESNFNMFASSIGLLRGVVLVLGVSGLGRMHTSMCFEGARPLTSRRDESLAT